MISFDYAIVGSGVSGGRMAYRLAEAGASCLLIEAGRHFERKTFPTNELGYSTQMFWGGGMEITQDGRLGLLRAKCLGGTSVVNQALLDPFDEQVFSDWRDRSGIKDLNLEKLQPYYERSKDSIETRVIPKEARNRNAEIFCRALERGGFEWKSLFRAQSDCAWEKGSDCIVCLGGCPRGSKQSTLETSIPAAIQKGLSLETDFEVMEIHEQKDRVTVVGRKNGKTESIPVARVILAAGALGNATLLFRSGMSSRFPALGKGFSCHPQFMTFAAFKDPVDAHKGAFQSVKSHDPQFRKAGFKFENVFAQPIGAAMLIPGLGRKHLKQMKKYRHLASMEVCIQDENAGEMFWRGGRLQIRKPLTQQDKKRRDEGLSRVASLFQSVGTSELIHCHQGFGLHLMGGCALGNDPAKSVVSPDFSLHGSRRIFSADSSIFPSAPGINPSYTIMAVTEWAAEKILRTSA